MVSRENREPPITGHRHLAAFLTENGFPIAKQTLDKLSMNGKGPPIHGRWANRNLFLPTEAISWARARMYGSATAG
jgi:hypothetical protein